MMQTKEEIEDRFTAEDSDGNQRTIIQMVKLTLVSSVDEPSRWVPGSRSYRLEYGTSLKKLDDNTFEVPQTKLVFNRR